MKATLLSGVSTSVWKRRTALTVPSVPCDEMKSPSLKGLVTMMMTPPARFCSWPLRAIPTARPIEARTAAKDTDFTPSTPAKKRKRAMYSIAVKTESRSETATPSILRRRRIPLKIFFRRVMTTLPSQKRTSTRMTRSPKLIPALSHSSSMLRLNQCLMSRLRGCVAAPMASLSSEPAAESAGSICAKKRGFIRGIS